MISIWIPFELWGPRGPRSSNRIRMLLFGALFDWVFIFISSFFCFRFPFVTFATFRFCFVQFNYYLKPCEDGRNMIWRRPYLPYSSIWGCGNNPMLWLKSFHGASSIGIIKELLLNSVEFENWLPRKKKNFLTTFASYCGYLRRWAILHGPVFCSFCQRLLIKICVSKK